MIISNLLPYLKILRYRFDLKEFQNVISLLTFARNHMCGPLGDNMIREHRRDLLHYYATMLSYSLGQRIFKHFTRLYSHSGFIVKVIIDKKEGRKRST